MATIAQSGEGCGAATGGHVVSCVCWLRAAVCPKCRRGGGALLQFQ